MKQFLATNDSEYKIQVCIKTAILCDEAIIMKNINKINNFRC